MTNPDTPGPVHSVKELFLNAALLLLAMAVYTVLNHYYPGVVQPLVFPLGVLTLSMTVSTTGGRLFREMVHVSSRAEGAEQKAGSAAKLAGDAAEMASNAAAQIEQLRRELNPPNKPLDTKAAGFHIPPDATPPAVTASQDDERLAWPE